MPCQKKRLVQLIEEVEDNVVISDNIKSRSRKLTIDEDDLHIKFKQSKLSVSSYKRYIISSLMASVYNLSLEACVCEY